MRVMDKHWKVVDETEAGRGLVVVVDKDAVFAEAMTPEEAHECEHSRTAYTAWRQAYTRAVHANLRERGEGFGPFRIRFVGKKCWFKILERYRFLPDVRTAVADNDKDAALEAIAGFEQSRGG